MSERYRQYHIPIAVVAARTHAPLAHNEQRGYARCPLQQASCVWFQPSPLSGLTATTVVENAMVDCTDSVVKPTRTATSQCSASRCGRRGDENGTHVNEVNVDEI